jgi:hypothetical protein
MKKTLLLLTFILLALPSWVLAQPSLRVIYSESDSVKVGEDFIVYIFLEDVTDEYAYASLTLWFYYDASLMKLEGHSFEKSIIPDLGSPFFTENFNKKIPANANYAKLNIGFYRATRVVKNGLLVELKMKALAAGKPDIRFSYADLGSYEFTDQVKGIVSDSIKIVNPKIKMISPEKQ